MSSLLDSRVIRILRWLLSQDRPRSTSELAADLGLSERVVRYRLATAERYLNSVGAELSRKRGQGLELLADLQTRTKISIDLDQRPSAPRVYTPEEREHLMLAALLWSAPDVVPLDRFNEELEVSKTSARRDLHRCEPWLARAGLPLMRKSGKGLVLLGQERQVRRALVQLLLEAVPLEVLEELAQQEVSESHSVNVRVPAGLRDRIAALPIHHCAQAIRRSQLELGDNPGNSELVFALYLAVSLGRFEAGRKLQLDAGQHISLVDHPVSMAVQSVVDEVAADLDVDLPSEELAGLTEYALGLDAVAAVAGPPRNVRPLVKQLLTLAAERLHPSLAEDAELRSSLAMHLTRLSVRLRHGLPVHNPLLGELLERYPEVHAVAEEIRPALAAEFGEEVTDDEIGFITMYLSGSLERSFLRPQKQALIVCPSGMATAWVLVSRVKAEFPALSIAQVRSVRQIEDSDIEQVDLIISTVSLPEVEAPVVVVNPLLSASDVRAVNEHL